MFVADTGCRYAKVPVLLGILDLLKVPVTQAGRHVADAGYRAASEDHSLWGGGGGGVARRVAAAGRAGRSGGGDRPLRRGVGRPSGTPLGSRPGSGAGRSGGDAG